MFITKEMKPTGEPLKSFSIENIRKYENNVKIIKHCVKNKIVDVNSSVHVTLRRLTTNNARIDVIVEFGSILGYACFMEDYNLCKYLIKNKADLNITTNIDSILKHMNYMCEFDYDEEFILRGNLDPHLNLTPLELYGTKVTRSNLPEAIRFFSLFICSGVKLENLYFKDNLWFKIMFTYCKYELSHESTC